MVKGKGMQVKRKPVVKQMKKKAIKSPQKPFGPVATIDTAPVSIGNTVRGAEPIVVQTREGVRIKGRDFLITIPGVAAVDTSWQLVAACPLAPACMVASAIRSFANAYAQYTIHGMAFHFITAESTGNSGNILLYPVKDRAAPGLNTLSSNFLPLVLSDPHAVIGPLWNNCSAVYLPPLEWRPTDVFNCEDLRHQAAGELMVFTKSAALNAPGYVLVDYDISFRSLSINPKTATLPVARMKYTQVALAQPAALTAGGVSSFSMSGGALLDAVSVSSPPTGCVFGDVYKVVLSLSNNGLAGRPSNGVLAVNVPGGAQAVTITEGFTCYGLVSANGSDITLYPDYSTAMASVFSATSGSTFVWAASFTANLNIQAFVSLVGSHNPGIAQASF